MIEIIFIAIGAFFGAVGARQLQKTKKIKVEVLKGTDEEVQQRLKKTLPVGVSLDYVKKEAESGNYVKYSYRIVKQ